MFFSLLIIILLIILVLGKYILPIWQRYLQLRHEYRGITLLPIASISFVGNLHQVNIEQELVFKLLIEQSKICQDQNKGLFCIWNSLWPVVFLCSGKGLETFINNNKQLVKSFDYTLLEPWLKTGLLTSNHEKWRQRRRLITPSFHDTRLLHSFMDIFNEQTSILMRRFDEIIKQNKMIDDFHSYISDCTLDIIAETATGTSPKAQSSHGKNEFVRATVRMGEIFDQRTRSPWLWRPFIFDLSPLGREQKRALDVVQGFSRKIIEERIATFDPQQLVDGENKKSIRRLVFLDSLLDQLWNNNLSRDDVQEEVDTFMFTGHDTTATATTFFCYLMGCHLDVQAKVQAEMDSIFGDDRERACTTEDIQRMTYLDCVIKECMRFLSVVPAVSREAQEDFYYRDQIIRKGTTVIIFLHAIHRDANVFPNPDKFDPDRFVDESIISSERSPFDYIPFSAGSRNCVGQRFAGLEERVLLSTLFRHFSFRSVQTIDELRLFPGMVLRSRVPIQMVIEHR